MQFLLLIRNTNIKQFLSPQVAGPQKASSRRQPLPPPELGIPGTSSEQGRRWIWSPSTVGRSRREGNRGGQAAARYPKSLFAVSLRLKQECSQRNLIVIDRRKRYSQVYVLNNCFLFCSGEQVIKMTFVSTNLDHTYVYVLESCKPKHAKPAFHWGENERYRMKWNGSTKRSQELSFVV